MLDGTPISPMTMDVRRPASSEIVSPLSVAQVDRGLWSWQREAFGGFVAGSFTDAVHPGRSVSKCVVRFVEEKGGVGPACYGCPPEYNQTTCDGCNAAGTPA